MEAAMKLRAYIKLEDNGTMTARSELIDGSAFSFTVGQYDVQLNEDFTDKQPEVTGFVYVVQLSIQGSNAYVKLPAPTIEHGNLVTVHKFKLQPHGQSIKDFQSPLGLKEPPKELQGTGLVKNPIPKEVSGKRFVDVSTP